MFPGYHLLVAAMTAFAGPSLTACRSASTILTTASLLLAARIVSHLRIDGPFSPPASPAALRDREFLPSDKSSPTACVGPILCIASNPFWLPFAALVYTENAALPLLLAALLFTLRRRPIVAAILLAASCFIRQSNAVWSLLFLVLIGIDAWRRRELASCSTEPREQWAAAAHVALRRGWPFLLLIVAVVALSAFRPEALQSNIPENQPRLNRAQYYCFALSLILLAVPVGLLHLRDFGQTLRTHLFKPLLPAAAIAAAGVLEVAFVNPHPWNGDLNYLRNWPLVYMSLNSLLRFALSLLIVISVVAAAIWIRRQTRRAELLAVLASSLIYLAPHALVDPRYYIAPTLLFALFADFSPAERRLSLAWNVGLNAAVCAFILARGSAEGGIW